MSESFVLTSDNCDFVYSNDTNNSLPKKQALDLLNMDEYVYGVSNSLYAVEKWLLSSVLFDTALLVNFLKAAQADEEISLQSYHPAVHTGLQRIERTEAAEAFINSYGLESASIAVEVALYESFEDIRQTKLDLDPGDEEEDDHPWIRVYVQTGMNAASTLKARRKFYKLLDDAVTSEESSFFHLSFRVVS